MKTIKIFTHNNCPACPSAKLMGEKLKDNFNIEFFDVGNLDGMAEATLQGINRIPTIIIEEDNKVIKKWVGTPHIKEVKEWMKKEII